MGGMNLARGEVHIWSVTLDATPDTSRLCATLSDDELDRAARLKFDRDQRRFIVARGALRELLGRYVGAHAAELRFAYNPAGKPELSSDFGSQLRFNLSHAAELALIAVATDADVGVDVEYIQPQPDAAAIAREFLSPREVGHLSGLPSDVQARAFLHHWTKHEARVKARGQALGNDAPTESHPLRRWSLYKLQPARGYVGALAIEGSGWVLRHQHWHPPAP